MGKINIIGKWDLNENKWKTPTTEEYGKSFSLAIYEPIINDENSSEINYIIIANGTRIEQHTKDFNVISDKELKINYVKKHFEKQKGNYQIISLFMDNDAPLIEAAKLFSEYIDNLAINENTKSINLISVSKCGTMSFYTPRFFKYEESFNKTSLHNVAVPYQGTKFASPFIIFQEVKSLLNAKLGNNELSKKSYLKLLKIYKEICSNSHMDYDIAQPGGIPAESHHKYDKNYIKNIFSKENIEAIKRIQLFKNYTTQIDEKTFIEALLSLNIKGIGLCFADELLFHGKSDGLTSLHSQKTVEKVLDIKSEHLKSAHHDVTSIPKVYNKILDEITSSIQNTKQKKNIRQLI
ncbi:MAG: hypothetical protein IJ399_02340 [Bacilli bacterium]|nr:hypothetical protein [Bacilli bacterium]